MAPRCHALIASASASAEKSDRREKESDGERENSTVLRRLSRSLPPGTSVFVARHLSYRLLVIVIGARHQ